MFQSKERTNEAFVTERTLGTVTLALLKVLTEGLNLILFIL